MIITNRIDSQELLIANLKKYDYRPVVVKKFDNVLDQFCEISPELVIIDVPSKKFDAFSWCRQIRNISICPIVFFSKFNKKMEQIMALEYGADDYIAAPFHYGVILARIRSHLRRVYGEYASKLNERIINCSGLILYTDKMELKYDGKSISLTKKEEQLVELLLKNYPSMVHREEIFNKLWDGMKYIDENTLSVYITRIRYKLKELGIKNALETIRGSGYRLHNTWEKSIHPLS
ncbi:response regulator transcription factor [Bacillus cereus]|nr:response regulator transcription factor [Bacillus cereus]MCU5026039.1 response regulator transcription factor [Bacillus cereus]MCU5646347.1 response regulator transcription factor [Bacillus cereus]MDA2644480.1 response regulator transcription factor [Bacillus cereus]PFA42188.1 two-component system response regulator [Bacillus cereus]WCT67333.1 response regulator transcription factor [Bacillus cereus]